MNLQTVLNDIKMLPPDKQEEAADFIAFLKNRPGIDRDRSPAESAAGESDSFFGMWADREDVKDSSLWGRELRTSEWKARYV